MFFLLQAIRRSLLDQKRVFREVPEARVFRPTIEECTDFLGYVASIQDIGNEEGMIKIIPPEGEWLLCLQQASA